MLEFCKLILQKVSFDAFLFEKELKKSCSYLLPMETQDLLDWAAKNFGEKYGDVIEQIHKFLQ